MRYNVHGQQREARATREVVVSAGSINSPQLLELSGVGQPERLKAVGIEMRHELKGVGENLRDHYSPRMKWDGAAGENFQLAKTSGPSANSITLITDPLDNIIAYPVAGKSVRSRSYVELANVSDLDQPQIVQAVRLHKTSGLDRFRFETDDKEYVALFSKIPDIFFMQWEVIVVAPLDDFVGALKQTNRKLIWLMAALVVLESAMIYAMARRISRPIEAVSGAIERIRSLSFSQTPFPASRVREIDQLQRATVLLDNALRSFSVFVPVGLVRRLIESGKPLAPAVEPRFMTIFFSDLENFTTISEQLSPQELSEQTSHYFEIVTVAVTEEQGTIDKFIGNSVMALGCTGDAGRPRLSCLSRRAKSQSSNAAPERRMGERGSQADADPYRHTFRQCRRRQCRIPATSQLYRDG